MEYYIRKEGDEDLNNKNRRRRKRKGL